MRTDVLALRVIVWLAVTVGGRRIPNSARKRSGSYAAMLAAHGREESALHAASPSARIDFSRHPATAREDRRGQHRSRDHFVHR